MRKAQEILRSFSDGQKQEFLKIDTQERLDQYVRSLPINPASPITHETADKISKIIPLIQTLAKALENYRKDTDDLWSCFALSVQSTGSSAEFVTSVLQAFEVLLALVPRLSIFTRISLYSEDLRQAVFEIYEGYFDLCYRCTRTHRADFAGILRKLRWQRELKVLDQLKLKVRNRMEKVNREAALDRRHTSPIEPSLPSSLGPRIPLNLSWDNIPVQNAQSFVARSKELEDIHGALRSPSGADSMRIVVLYGLSGMGKSQIALRYAHMHRKEFAARFWVPCETPISRSQSFQTVAELLGLETSKALQSQRLVKNWLSSTDWLLVLDDVPGPDTLSDMLPSTSRGCVLITTTNQLWRIQEFVSASICIDRLKDDEAAIMLESTLARQHTSMDREAALAIARELGGLPLSIRQIGSYIAERSVDPSTFLQAYRDKRYGRQIDSWDESCTKLYVHTLSDVWRLQFETLSPHAMFLIRIVSFLDAGRLPEGMFNGEGEDGEQTTVDAEYNAAIKELSAFSLVTRSLDDQEPQTFLQVHSQVVRQVLATTSPEESQRVFEWTIKRLRTRFPRQSPIAEPLSSQWNTCKRWISQVIAFRSRSTELRDRLSLSPTLAELLVDASIYLWEKGLIEEGRRCIDEARMIDESTRVENPSLKAEIYSFNACILQESGDFKESHIFFEREVDCRRQSMLKMHDSGQTPSMLDEIRLANAYNNFAGICLAEGELRDAEMYNKISLDLKNKWLQQNQSLKYLVSLSYTNMASVNGQLHRFELAAEDFRKAIEYSQDSAYIPRRALVYHSFGCMRASQGHLEDAQDLLTEAYHLRFESLGDHYDTALTLHMLASVYSARDDLANSRDLLIEALRIFEAVSQDRGVDFRRVARSTFKLSCVLRELNDASADQKRAEAIRMLERCELERISDEVDGEYFDSLVVYI